MEVILALFFSLHLANGDINPVSVAFYFTLIATLCLYIYEALKK